MKEKRQRSIKDTAHECIMFCSRHSIKASVVAAVLSVVAVGAIWGMSFFDRAQSSNAATLPQLNSNFPVVDGISSVIAKDSSGALYVGGNFSFIGKHSGSGVPTDATTGDTTTGFPYFGPSGGYSMPVTAAVPDGSGGWYVGGNFTQAGSATGYNPYLAHVLANNTIDTTFTLVPNGPVNAMAIQGTTLYIAGSFTSVSGTARGRIAAIDLNTKTLKTWNPNANNTVYSMVVTPSLVYVGGDFTRLNGTAVTRNRIAAIDINSNTITAWNPGANSTIFTMALSGTTLWTGGYFSSIGGKNKQHLAALDTTKLITATTTNPIATNWETACNNAIRSIAISGTTLYAAGDFYLEGCSAGVHNGVAAFSTTNNDFFTNIKPWNPQLTAKLPLDTTVIPTVSAVTVAGGNVYIGGLFDTAGGQERKNVAAFVDDASVANPMPIAWNPGASGNSGGYGGVNQGGVTMLAPDATGSKIFMGGGFAVAGGARRDAIAKIAPDGSIDRTWNVNIKELSWQDEGPYVYDILVDGTTAYIGGIFGNIAGQTRKNLAAVSTTNGTLLAWNPDIVPPPASGHVEQDSWVWDLDKYNNTIYVGSRYSSFNQSGGLYGIDATSGALTGWHPSISSSQGYYADPKRVIADASGVYVTGMFDNANGTQVASFAAFDHSGNLIPWTSNITQGSQGQNDMALIGSTLYMSLGYGWYYLNNQAYTIVKIDTNSGNVSGFTIGGYSQTGPVPQGTVMTKKDDGTLIYIGGNEGVFAVDLAAAVVGKSSGLYSGGSVLSMLSYGNDLYAAGDFTIWGTSNNNYYHPGIIRLDMNPILPPDNVGPVISTVSPTTALPGVPVTLTATATDQSGVNLCALSVNGSFITSPFATVTPPGGQSATVTMTYTFATAGTYNVGFVCVDINNKFTTGPTTTVAVGQAAPADTTAPTSSAAPAGTQGQNGWYTSAVNVALSAIDNAGGSGVKEIRYSTDGSTFTTTTGSTAQVAVNADGATTVYYYAVDVAGNIEAVKTLLVKIDTTAPQMVTLAALPEFDNTNGVTLNWTPGTDVTSGVGGYKVYRCSTSTIGGSCAPTSLQTTVTTGYADTGLTDNNKYIYKVSVVDNAGLESTLSNDASVTEDSTAPTTPVLDAITVSGYTNATSANLGWSAASDPNTLASGVKNYNVNKNGSVIATPTSRSYDDSGLVEGQSYAYKVSATDNATNTGLYSNTSSVTVDSTAPTSQASVASGIVGFDNWYLSDVTVEITATDTVSGIAKIEYSVNGGAYQQYFGQFLITDEGTTTITYRATDNAGNVETPDNTLTIKIDKTLPLLSATLTGTAGTNGWYTSNVDVTINSSDALSGVESTEYSFDGNTWIPYTTPVSISTIGSTTIYYRSSDKAGNISPVMTETVVIDPNAPVTAHNISGNQQPTPYTDWYYGSVALNFVAVDGIGESGIALTEYSLDGGVTYQTYSTSTPISLAPGSYNLTYRSKDNAGNTEAQVGPFTIKVDGDADTDNVPNNLDKCPNTPSGEQADADGCGPSQQDQDNDGVADRQDNCKGLAGKPEFQGCPYALFNDSDLHVHYHKTKEQGYSYNGYACIKDGKKHSNCKLPLVEGPLGDSRGEVVSLLATKVFTLSSLGQSDYGQLKKRCDEIYDGTYLSTGVTPVTEMSSIPSSKLIGVPSIQDYLVLLRVHITDPGANTTYATTLCKTIKKDEYNYNYDKTKPKNDPVAKVHMKMTKTVKPTGIQLTPNEEVVFTGSLLTVTYPDVAFWEEGVRDYVYAYIFESEGDWNVDVCSLVPQDYKVSGVYDETGNLVSTSDCMQAGVANEMKVIAFEVNKLHSPTVFDVTANMTVKHKGKTKKVKMTSKSEVVKKDRLVKKASLKAEKTADGKIKKFDPLKEVFERALQVQQQKKNMPSKTKPVKPFTTDTGKKKVK